jgi:hypothetical protein
MRIPSNGLKLSPVALMPMSRRKGIRKPLKYWSQHIEHLKTEKGRCGIAAPSATAVQTAGL